MKLKFLTQLINKLKQHTYDHIDSNLDNFSTSSHVSLHCKYTQRNNFHSEENVPKQ